MHSNERSLVWKIAVASTMAYFLGIGAAVPSVGQEDSLTESPSGSPMSGDSKVASESWASGNLAGAALFAAGGAHIVSQQCVDGGFGWPHDDCSETFYNITAPIQQGVLEAYGVTGDPALLASAVAAGDFALTYEFANGDIRLSAFSPFFLARLSEATGDPAYADFVGQFFDELLAGTYGDLDFDTGEWIASIEDIRVGNTINLRPWEFCVSVQTAAELGHPSQVATLVQGILRGLATLDNSDPVVRSSNLGLAGAVLGLAHAGQTSFPPINAPLHSEVNGVSTLLDLAEVLVGYQTVDGAWYRHSRLGDPPVGDESTQISAYAVLALAEADRWTTRNFAPEITAGQAWLEARFLANGGFENSPGGTENTEVEGEALWALAASPAPSILEVPTVGNVGRLLLTLLLGAAGLLLLRRA